MGSFPSVSANSTSAARTTGSVDSPPTTSTSRLIAAGKKKWSPAKRPGSGKPRPSAVTEKEEVLVTTIVDASTRGATSANSACLTSSSSNTASITSVAPCTAAARSVVNEIRPITSSRWAGVDLPRSIAPSSVFSISERPRAIAGASTSRTRTVNPA